MRRVCSASPCRADGQSAQTRDSAMSGTFRLSGDQQPQRMRNCLTAHLVPVTAKQPGLGLNLTGLYPTETDGAHRFLRRATTRPGNPAHRHRQGRSAARQGPSRHLAHHGFAHRPMSREGIGADPEHRLLGLIAISDKSALKPGTAAGDIRDALGNPPTGARLCSHQPIAARLQTTAKLGGQLVERLVDRYRAVWGEICCLIWCKIWSHRVRHLSLPGLPPIYRMQGIQPCEQPRSQP